VTLLSSPRRSLQGPGASARTGHRQECCSCFPLPCAASTAHMFINNSLLADPSEKYLPYTDRCSYFASNFLLSTMNLALRTFMMKKRHLLRWWQTSTSAISPLRFCQASVPLSQLPQMHLLSSFPAVLHTLPSRPRFLPGAFELAPHTKHASPYTLAAILPSRSGPGPGFLQASSGFLLHV